MGQTQTQLKGTARPKLNAYASGSNLCSKPETTASRADKPILVLDSMNREM